jgi:hypothetical protein
MNDPRLDIEYLVLAYAERLDLGDLDGVADLFAHATYRAESPSGTTVLTGTAEVRRVYDMLILYDGSPRTKLVTTNLIVDVDEVAGTATCRSYFTVLQATDGLPLQPIVAGRYHDTFERAADRWRFADRLILTDLVGDISHHLRTNPF